VLDLHLALGQLPVRLHRFLRHDLKADDGGGEIEKSI
jgi:hypothetical protein